jgi:hypothetical protein
VGFGLLKLRLAERSQTSGANRPLQTTAIGLLQQNRCLILFAERPQAQRLRMLARWLHGYGKAEAGSSQCDCRSRSLQRMGGYSWLSDAINQDFTV